MDLRVKENMQDGPSWKGQYKEGSSWKGQINKRDLRVVYSGNPGQIPGLIRHIIIKRNKEAYAYVYESIYDI